MEPKPFWNRITFFKLLHNITRYFWDFSILKICREIAQLEFECDFRKVFTPLWTNMNMSCTLLIQLGRHDLKWFFVKALYEYGRCVVLVPVFSSPKLLFCLFIGIYCQVLLKRFDCTVLILSSNLIILNDLALLLSNYARELSLMYSEL